MRRLLPLATAALLVTSLGGFRGCPAGPGWCGCTLEFRMFPITVLDSAGQPAGAVTVTVRSRDTGRTFAPSLYSNPAQGVYVVLDDSHTLSRRPERVRATGQQGGSSFTADFSFTRDDCGCHISKLAGPDTVTLTP